MIALRLKSLRPPQVTQIVKEGAVGAELAWNYETGVRYTPWDGLRDHTDKAIDDGLWSRLSTDKASCLNRNCHYYRECPFFVARREIQEAEVVVANHALVMAAMEPGV